MTRDQHDYQRILDALPLMFFLKDTENRILLTNQPVAKTLGVAPEDMEGTHTSKWYPEEAEKYHQDDLEVMRSRTPKLGIVEPFQVSESEKHWISTDKYPHFDADGKVIGILVYIRDATQEALTEAALRRSEEQLQEANAELIRVLESISDGLWSVELDRDFRIVRQYCSPVVETITGRSAEFIGDDPSAWLEAIHPEDRAQVTGAALGLIGGREHVRVEEYRIQLPNDSFRWIRDSATARKSSEGGLRIDRVITDITAQREAADQREEFERRARHMQRLESLGILAGGVAHDFNNILIGILGYAELAKCETPQGSDALQYLDLVCDSALRAADLCKQMLAYSGRGRFSVEALDLSEIARSVTDLLKTAISRQARVEFRLEEDLPPIEAEATQVQQVVMNLLMNASDAIGDSGGTITLRTGSMVCDRETLSAAYVDDNLPEGTYAFIEVSDNGVGIAESDRMQIFDPFYTTKFTGRGLGLAAVLGIVRGHRGAVTLESEVGKGTVFRVLFPVSDKTQPEKSSDTPVVVAASGKGLVLVVDDEQIVRQVARKSLERSGYEVFTAPDGPEALDVFRQHQEEVSMVLLDLTMPTMDGHEVLAELKQLRPEVRVLLTSGYDERKVMSGRASHEGTGFIQKPYDPAALVRAVNEMLQSA